MNTLNNIILVYVCIYASLSVYVDAQGFLNKLAFKALPVLFGILAASILIQKLVGE